MAYGKREFAVAAGANSTIFTGGGGVYGIQLREATGVAAAGTVTIYDNTAASGTILAVLRLAADGEFQTTFPKGIKFATGLTVAAAGADVQGSLLVGGPGGLRAIPFAGVDALLRTVATAGPTNVDSIIASETAGAAAEWRMIDNTSVTGNGFAGWTHTANETIKLVFGNGGVKIGTGLQYDQIGGATSGAVYVF